VYYPPTPASSTRLSKCRASENIIPKPTTNITRMRTTVLESGFRNFDAQYELRRISNVVLFYGYFHASVNVCNSKFIDGLLMIFIFCIQWDNNTNILFQIWYWHIRAMIIQCVNWKYLFCKFELGGIGYHSKIFSFKSWYTRINTENLYD
jgi:hypothetical protein